MFVDALVMAASKSSCMPKVAKRPAEKVARRPQRAKAGLTAKSNPSSQAPRARNSFQLFFSDAIRQGTVRNIREAVPKWHGMSEEEKRPWVTEALQEKREQLQAKSASSGEATRRVRSRFARTAMGKSQISAAQSTPDTPRSSASKGDEVAVGSWMLSFTQPGSSEAIVGEGGFGCTYRGEHKVTGRVAAIKIFSAHAEYREECRREIKMYTYIGSLDWQRRFLHILEAGAEAPIPFVALPWAGVSLSSYFKELQKGTPNDKMCRSTVIRAVATQVADALTFLREICVAHTDIKPSNLMISEDMRIVVIDLHAAQRSDVQDFETRDQTFTTFPYRAPELWPAFRQEVTWPTAEVLPFADIWAYGVTLVETIRDGVSMFNFERGERACGRAISDFAKSPSALEKLVQTLPNSISALSGIRKMVRCALCEDAPSRSLTASTTTA